MRRLLVALLFCVSPAWGAIYTWQFDGQITSVSQHAAAYLPPVGTEIVFTATFDTFAPDSCGLPDSGFYVLPGGAATYLDHTYTAEWNALEAQNPSGNCSGSTQGATALRFVNFDGGSFTSATLGMPGNGPYMPTTIGQVTPFYFNLGYICVVCADGTGQITHVTELPGPPTLLLAAVGLLMLLRPPRHRRR